MFTDGNNETLRPGLPAVVECRHAIEMGARSTVCRWPIEISAILDSPSNLHGKSKRTALVAHGLDAMHFLVVDSARISENQENVPDFLLRREISPHSIPMAHTVYLLGVCSGVPMRRRIESDFPCVFGICRLSKKF